MQCGQGHSYLNAKINLTKGTNVSIIVVVLHYLGGFYLLNFENKNIDFIPTDEQLEAIARSFYPAIRAFFESEKGQREFEEWKKKQNSETAKDVKITLRG